MTTTDLAEFGMRELEELSALIQAWRDQGLPEDFTAHDVHPMLNKDSGFVFLTNSEYEVAMLNGIKLERLYNCCNCGAEGFNDDIALYEDNCSECKPLGDI